MRNIIIYIVIIYMLSINIITYYLMWRDKRRAQRGSYRISEKTLFVFALLGGAIGAWLGMQRFRHKTKKWMFVFGIPFIILLWTIGIIAIAWHYVL